MFGLKHATEVDHVVAVSTIVSQHKNVFHSALVGALWGAGHTASLLVIAAVVLTLRVAIPETVSGWLEFGVALMIIGLGISALWRALRKSGEVHLHQHSHDGLSHTHVHFHETETRHAAGFACATLARSVAHRLEAGFDWHDARPGRIRSIDSAGADAD